MCNWKLFLVSYKMRSLLQHQILPELSLNRPAPPLLCERSRKVSSKVNYQKETLSIQYIYGKHAQRLTQSPEF